MWHVTITWGSLEQMREKCKQSGNGTLCCAGSFNEKFNSTSRAALVQIGVRERYDGSYKGVQECPWEGVYWYISVFDEQISQGLFPIKADWDGKTYIQRWSQDKPYYQLTDTYRY